MVAWAHRTTRRFPDPLGLAMAIDLPGYVFEACWGPHDRGGVPGSALILGRHVAVKHLATVAEVTGGYEAATYDQVGKISF